MFALMALGGTRRESCDQMRMRRWLGSALKRPRASRRELAAACSASSSASLSSSLSSSDSSSRAACNSSSAISFSAASAVFARFSRFADSAAALSFESARFFAASRRRFSLSCSAFCSSVAFFLAFSTTLPRSAFHPAFAFSIAFPCFSFSFLRVCSLPALTAARTSFARCCACRSASRQSRSSSRVPPSCCSASSLACGWGVLGG